MTPPPRAGRVAPLPLLVVAVLAFVAGRALGPWPASSEPDRARPGPMEAVGAVAGGAGVDAADAGDHDDAADRDVESAVAGEDLPPPPTPASLAAEAEIRRLREQLIEKERRLEALTGTVAALRAAAADDDADWPTVSRTSERVAAPGLLELNAALRTGGAPEARVLELQDLVDGVLLRPLVSLPPADDGSGGVQRWERGFLEVRDGVVHLVLEQAGDDDGGPAARHELTLRTADPDLFAQAGLPLDGGSVLVAHAAEALRTLVAPHALELLSLGGVRGDLLLDLELIEFDADGVLLRRLRAGRAQVVPDGPTLVLQDGEVIVDGESRPFYRGVLRLPLPGAPYADWLATLFG